MDTAGLGGRQGLGTPFQLDYTQLAATATAENAKSMLAIVENSLDVSFTQFGGNVWRYDSSANRPVLPMFVHVALSEVAEEDNQERTDNLYQNLVGQLPPRMRYYLLKDHEPAALEQILKNLAALLALLESPNHADPVQAINQTGINQGLPSLFLNTTLNLAQETIEELEKAAQYSDLSAGSSSAVKEVLDKTSALKSDIGTFIKNLQQQPDESFSLLTLERSLTKLSNQSFQSLQAYEQLRSLVDGQVLSETIKHLALLPALAATRKLTPLSVATFIAMTSSSTTSSSIGVIGPEWAKFVNSQLLGISEKSTKETISSLATVIWEFSLSFSLILNQDNPNKTHTALSVENFGKTDLLPLSSIILANSQLLTHVFSLLTAPLNLSDSLKTSLIDSLSLTALFLTFLARIEDGQQLPPLPQSTLKIIDHLLTSLINAIEGKDFEKSQAPLSISLQQARLYLNENQPAALQNAVKSFFQAFEGDPQALNRDLNTTLSCVLYIINSNNDVKSDFSKITTAITQAA